MSIDDSIECDSYTPLEHMLSVDAQALERKSLVRTRLSLSREALFVSRLHKLGSSKLVFRFPLSKLVVAIGADPGTLALVYGNRYLVVHVISPIAVKEAIESFCHAWGGWVEWGTARGRGEARGPEDVPWGSVCCAPEQEIKVCHAKHTHTHSSSPDIPLNIYILFFLLTGAKTDLVCAIFSQWQARTKASDLSQPDPLCCPPFASQTQHGLGIRRVGLSY